MNKVTFGKTVFEPRGQTRPVSEITEAIRNGEYGRLIKEIRDAPSEERKQALKKDLPWFNMGLFRDNQCKNDALLSTKHIIFDIDKKGNPLVSFGNGFRKKLSSYPYIQAIFLSPGGQGAKVICELPQLVTSDKEYKAFWKAGTDFFQKELGLRNDPATKDVRRICYLSHDPEIYADFNKKPLPIKPVKDDPPPAPRDFSGEKDELSEVYRAIDSFKNTTQLDRSTWYGIGCTLREKFGDIEGRNLFNHLSINNFYPNDTNIDKTWEEVQSRSGGQGMTLGTIFKFAQEKGFTFSKVYNETINTEALRPDEIRGTENNDELSLPLDLMTGVAGDFAKVYSHYLESPTVFFYFTFLTIIGNALADKITIKSELKPEPRFYAALLGESADERKSTAIKGVVDFFFEFFPNLVKVSWGVNSAEGLQSGLAAIEHGRMLLVFDELKAFVAKCKSEKSVLLPCVNTLFENDRYESRTKDKHVMLENVHLSLVGASTIPTYETLWSSTFLDIGFTNRLFLVPGKGMRKNPIPAMIPHNEKQVIVEQVAAILERAKVRRELELTEDANALFSSWYMNLERSVHSRRLDTYALRLMPLLAVNDFKEEIDRETVAKTIKIMNWQLKVREQLDPIDADNKIAEIEEKIRRKLKMKPFTKSALKHAVHYERVGTWIFDTALRNMGEEVGYDKKGKVLFLK